MDVKSVAKAHGLTMVEVAKKMGITKGGLSQVINGNPTITSLRLIAKVIGCKVGDFFIDEMTKVEEDSTICKCPYCGHELKVKIE